MDDLTYRQVLAELQQLPAQAGLNLNDLLMASIGGGEGTTDFSAATRQLLSWLLRRNRFTTGEVADHLGQTPSRARQLLKVLEARGYLRSERQGRLKQYHLRLQTAHTQPASRRGEAHTLWQILGDENR